MVEFQRSVAKLLIFTLCSTIICIIFLYSKMCTGEHCDLKSFVISKFEINSQTRFENADDASIEVTGNDITTKWTAGERVKSENLIQNSQKGTTFIDDKNRTYGCSVDHLSIINSTDTRILESCLFPVISLDAKLDEKIDNLESITLPFLKNYKNPCWYESLPDNVDQMYHERVQMFRDQANRSYDVMRPVMRDRITSGHMWRIRCLPLVYVIGVAKCGTTDLWSHFIRHKDVVRPATKEPMFWNFDKWQMNAKIADYLDLFDEAAEIIRKSAVIQKENNTTTTYHPKITLDMSVETLFRFEGTQEHFHDNDENNGPKHISPYMIKNITPDAKIILLVRNPTERLFSEYLFFNRERSTSAKEFHLLASRAVQKMERCLKLRPARSCVYDHKYTAYNRWVRLVAGMYAPFVRDWLSVFPHMRVYRTEDYHVNRTGIFTDMLQYIGLDIHISEDLDNEEINNKRPMKKSNIQMLDKTRKLLDDFYHSFNEDLAELLEDRRFLFSD